MFDQKNDDLLRPSFVQLGEEICWKAFFFIVLISKKSQNKLKIDSSISHFDSFVVRPIVMALGLPVLYQFSLFSFPTIFFFAFSRHLLSRSFGVDEEGNFYNLSLILSFYLRNEQK